MVDFWRDGQQLIKLNDDDVELAKLMLACQEDKFAVIWVFRNFGKSLLEACDIVHCAKDALKS